MTYNINPADSRKPPIEVLADTERTDFPVKIFGRAFLEYGEQLNESLLNLLENFSAPQAIGMPIRPSLVNTNGIFENPVQGQLWHNSTDDGMYFYTGEEWIRLGDSADIGANWGQIAHGQQIPRPVSPGGYTFSYEECIWSVSPADYRISSNYVGCFTDSEANVTIQYRRPADGLIVGSVANYLIIGIRGNNNTGIYPAPPIPSQPPTPTPPPTPDVSPTPPPIDLGSVWLAMRSGEIGRYNLTTGVFSPLPSLRTYIDIAFDGNTLWGVSAYDSAIPPTTSIPVPVTNRLYRISTVNGSVVGSPVTITGLPSPSAVITGLCVGPGGDLYGHGPFTNGIYRINKTTGAATRVIDLTGLPTITADLVYDPSIQRFFFFSGSTLRSASITTGTLFTVGVSQTAGGVPYPHDRMGGLVLNNGNLIGFTFDTGEHVAINKTNAIVSPVRFVTSPTGGSYQIFGAAFDDEGFIPPLITPTPTPTTPTPTPTGPIQCNVTVDPYNIDFNSGNTVLLTVRSTPNSSLLVSFSPSFQSSFTVNTNTNGVAFVAFDAPSVVSLQTFSININNATVSGCGSWSGIIRVSPVTSSCNINISGIQASYQSGQNITLNVSSQPFTSINITLNGSSVSNVQTNAQGSATVTFPAPSVSTTTNFTLIASAPSCASFSGQITVTAIPQIPPLNAILFNSNLGPTSAFGGFNTVCSYSASSSQSSGVSCSGGNIISCSQFSCAPASTTSLGITVTGGTPPYSVSFTSSGSLPPGECFTIGSSPPITGTITTPNAIPLGQINTSGGQLTNIGMLASCGSANISANGSLNILITDSSPTPQTLSTATTWQISRTGNTQGQLQSVGFFSSPFSVLPGSYSIGVAVNGMTNTLAPFDTQRLTVVPETPQMDSPIGFWIDTGSVLGDEPPEWAQHYWVRFRPTSISGSTGVAVGTPNTWTQVGTVQTALLYNVNIIGPGDAPGVGVNNASINIAVDIGYSTTGSPPSSGTEVGSVSIQLSSGQVEL